MSTTTVGRELHYLYTNEGVQAYINDVMSYWETYDNCDVSTRQAEVLGAACGQHRLRARVPQCDQCRHWLDSGLCVCPRKDSPNNPTGPGKRPREGSPSGTRIPEDTMRAMRNDGVCINFNLARGCNDTRCTNRHLCTRCNKASCTNGYVRCGKINQ